MNEVLLVVFIRLQCEVITIVVSGSFRMWGIS